MSKPTSKKKKWLIPAIVIGLTLAVFVIGLVLSDPPPPKKVRLAAGSPGGAYTAYGKEFVERLRATGLQVELVNTAGSIENYRLLSSNDPQEQVDLAFVQGGTRDSAFAERRKEGARLDLEALPVRGAAILYSEPLWLFYRKDRFSEQIDRLSQLEGATINVGPDGSGTQPVARDILAANGISDPEKLRTLGSKVAIDTLLDGGGELDAIILVSSPRAPNIRRLLEAQEIDLMDFHRHVAYSKALPYLSKVELAQGVVDLSADLPRKSVSLLAPKAMLACRTELHPRVVELFYKAAQDIFRSGNPVDPAGAYPDIAITELAVAPAAEEYVRHGEGWLSRNLPFWAVRLISQLKLLVLPLITVLLPAFKLVPMVLKFRAKRLLKQHYQALSEAEAALQEAATPADLEAGLNDVANLRDRLKGLSKKFPATLQHELYHWRLHLNLVRSDATERLDLMRQKGPLEGEEE